MWIWGRPSKSGSFTVSSPLGYGRVHRSLFLRGHDTHLFVHWAGADAEAACHVLDANFGVFEQPYGSGVCRGRLAFPACRRRGRVLAPPSIPPASVCRRHCARTRPFAVLRKTLMCGASG